MKKGSLAIIIVYAFIALVIVSLLSLLFRALEPEPPQKEVESARKAIAIARDHQSDVYSPRLFREAQNNYDSAMVAWRNENKKFILFRDFDNVRSLAAEAEKKADEASQNSIVRSGDLKMNLDNEINKLKKELAEFEKAFLSLPLPQDVKRKHARGKLLLKEAEIDFQKENYVNGNIKITEADECISGTFELAREKLKEYFKNYPDWQKWTKETISESRKNGSYAIIIEKIPGLCHLYQNGREKYTFQAEFGSNWLGDKMSDGDMATPEGSYYVTKKLSGKSTMYYKALMINFPNDTDIKEFHERICNGQLPADARIGDMIEIHGEGGKGGNWTQGCIALKNKDMDLLFKYASKGTPVTIVGSVSTLDEYYSSQSKQ